ncbi:hypothetical protein CDD80_1493 [Ophiocordyceps camponoti-rufipedis]|uniref:ATP-dependent DNA helicase n=1 Tax=Ophiocordyceps camponoti-rufipedis TaxID=2004952 RepID=A0A2C5Z9Y6_9HYPO|nr:hypothetical protein CDD80_1493 [Ophiocordyceps camponoti-rufipedis]
MTELVSSAMQTPPHLSAPTQSSYADDSPATQGRSSPPASSFPASKRKRESVCQTLRSPRATMEMSQESTATVNTSDGDSQPLFWYQTTGGDSPPPFVRQQSDASTEAIQPLTSTEPKLCGEQQYIVDLIAGGRNVFFTGSAGCGKSTVLKAALNMLREKDPDLKVHVLAPTGQAALQINGVTTWSYMGWTPDYHKLAIEKLKRKGWRKHVEKRLKETEILVIDEISMIENHHFERINACMKFVRQYHLDAPERTAFGGVQIIVTGDFCQLPPVKPFRHCMSCGKEMQVGVAEMEFSCSDCHVCFRDNEKWAFMSSAWEECQFEHVHLRKIHRQKDEKFVKMLQKCRLGIPFTPFELRTLTDHRCNVARATHLFSTRAEVKRVNDENFYKLKTPVATFCAHDGFTWEHERHPQLEHYNNRAPDGTLEVLRDSRLQSRVDLRIGMLVALQINLDLPAGLCNGSQGIICGFEDYDPARLPRRWTAKDPPTGLDMDQQKIGGDYAALKEIQIKGFVERQERKLWPRVLFHNGIRRTIYASCMVNTAGDEAPYSLLYRTQIPLVAAWALSIHKSQGMTLDRVIVDLSKAFEEGQVYVALSRARSLEGLKVEGAVEGLAVGNGGNPDVQRFLEDKFGSLRATMEASEPQVIVLSP